MRGLGNLRLAQSQATPQQSPRHVCFSSFLSRMQFCHRAPPKIVSYHENTRPLENLFPNHRNPWEQKNCAPAPPRLQQSQYMVANVSLEAWAQAWAAAALWAWYQVAYQMRWIADPPAGSGKVPPKLSPPEAEPPDKIKVYKRPGIFVSPDGEQPLIDYLGADEEYIY